MNKPLLITDCDEVLLHMIRHFGEWLRSEHDIDFVPHPQDFFQSLRHRNGKDLELADGWRLLNNFFETEMHRQTLVPHAIDALARISEIADIVILTNLIDDHHGRRVAQLDQVGIRHEVFCNQGGKGSPVARLIKEREPSVTVFVDDLPTHHSSVAKHAPEVWRVHMVAEAEMAGLIPPAADAHIRIDCWKEAADWIEDKMLSAQPASIGQMV